jgi:hypothetical protein
MDKPCIGIAGNLYGIAYFLRELMKFKGLADDLGI